MSESEEGMKYIDVEPIRNDSISTNRPQHSHIENLSSGSLDKIRDILFGTQVREYDKRFGRLEERLLRECTELREETKKRMDALEVYIRNEVESLTEVVKKQQVARDEVLKELTQEHKHQVEILEKKLSDLDEQANKVARDLRQQILDQSKNMNDDIGKKYAEILATVERETQEIRNDKANRITLSALFAELAMRLRSE
jgi:vacuolar-type H+-ATPase subunit I/STV1